MKVDHTEQEVDEIPFQTKHALDDDILHSFELVDVDGYYAHHNNYMKLLHKTMVGIHPVDVIHCTYFINHDTLKDIVYDDSSKRHEYVVFSDNLRKKNIKQYLINNNFFGILTWHTDEEILKKDLQNYWLWALPEFKISDDQYLGYFDTSLLFKD